ncbi:hypothetical protein [Labilibaculum sp.]|uniref:BPSS1187 family protein n=1 Tax=Labilibaculum sp. TaxID=2060723 RepID=UPI003565BCB7
MNRAIKLLILIIGSGLYHQFALGQQNTTNPSRVKNEIEFTVKPSTTDSTIKASDYPHLVMYDASIPQAKLFLFLPGTNGIPEKGPKELFKTAIQQGYRVINLSYINKQAVAGVCKGENLVNDCDCTEKFRTQRVFGTKMTTLIPDEPQDAIVHRLTKLIMYLNKIDEKGNWDMYLENGSINWNIITVAGQSQGGGMAAFIAKRELVNRVITFSGGWDFSKKSKIAKWYFNTSITPPERWFGTYHSQEPRASVIDETYRAMDIPENHIYPLNLKIREGKRAHGEGIRNIIYKELWIEILGDGHIK